MVLNVNAHPFPEVAIPEPTYLSCQANMTARPQSRWILGVVPDPPHQGLKPESTQSLRSQKT